MWWQVVQTPFKEVHVYPMNEKHEHLLREELCICLPEVKETSAGVMVVHKKLRDQRPKFNAHWLRGS